MTDRMNPARHIQAQSLVTLIRWQGWVLSSTCSILWGFVQ